MLNTLNHQMETEEMEECQERHHHQLAYLKNKMPTQQEMETVAELFKVFGDPTRLKLLAALLGQEMCVCDLSDLLGISQSAVSHQLRLLRASRLVKNRREGKSVFYSLDDDHVATILAQGMEHVRHQ
ncbi:metalloregulator ArsR/SmtB family transcription factor [uncultured Negativibacillus sp.]|uniref:ArsR/SmtB family transcription factor n=1 Tax=uncultured Negativibacillus sp. TaxID=1980696 RepID=UPI0025F223A1|nr:metalloregulator ArsR/SmtB family transcription factor [uncultured Negativibacillus sp.]